MTFIEKVVNGQSSLDQIDDAIEAWIKSEMVIGLPDFLGMTEYEFALWVKDSHVLASIVAAKTLDNRKRV